MMVLVEVMMMLVVMVMMNFSGFVNIRADISEHRLPLL